MDSIPQQLLVQVILILLNALFAATEIAVLSLNGTKLKKLKEKGDKTADKLLKLVEEPSGFLSTIQIGITLAGFLGSAFAAEGFSDPLVHWLYDDLGFTTFSLGTLNTLAVIVITIILSYFTLIFGELVPKRIAMQKSYEVAKLSCGIVRAVAFVMRPVVAFLSFSTNAILRLLHLKTEAEEEQVSEEEIRMMVDLGEETGVLDEDEKEWITNVFEFDDTPVRDIMVRAGEVIAVSIDATKEEILKLISEEGISRLPVYGESLNDIIGILHAKDFLIELQKKQPFNLKEMLHSAYFVPEQVTADVLFKDMQTRRLHFAVVINEFGEVSGIVTMEDLLEEIVGNIYDEYDDQEQPEIRKLSENKWKVSGNIDIEDLLEEIPLPVEPNDAYDTLGGLVLYMLGSVPKDGTRFRLELGGYSLLVINVDHHRIQEVIIEKNEGHKEQDEAAEQ